VRGAVVMGRHPKTFTNPESLVPSKCFPDCPRKRTSDLGISPRSRGAAHWQPRRAGILLDAINDDDLAAIVTKLVTQAKTGDMTAIKILFDRLAPSPRARVVTLDLPSLVEGTSRSKASALTAVLDAMAAGRIDPSEAEVIAGLVEMTAEAVQNCGGLKPLTAEQIEYAKLHPGYLKGWD
jgi:hypothetical protein